MNKFKTHFCESKDQAVPFALPGLRSYKQNLIFEDFKSRDKVLDLEKKPGFTTEISTIKGSKTPVVGLKVNKSFVKPQVFGINKGKVEKNEIGKNDKVLKVQKNSESFCEKTSKPKVVLKENLGKENQQKMIKDKIKPATALASLKAKLIESRQKAPASIISIKKSLLSVENHSKNHLSPSGKSSKTLNFDSKPRLLNQSNPNQRPSATRSVSRKRPKKQSFFELNSISYKISELSIAPLL